MSALIISRTFNDGPDKAISLGAISQSGSLDVSGLSRTLSYGVSDWNHLRVGILCAANEYPSMSYSRDFGLTFGMSSGSSTLNSAYGTSSNCVSAMMGKPTSLFGYQRYEWLYYSNSTGSYFSPTVIICLGRTNNANDVGGGGTGTNRIPALFNLGDANKRRTPIVFEISKSGASVYNLCVAGFDPTTVNSIGANRDFTKADLLSALTGSAVNAASRVSASSYGLSKTDVYSITHARNLDTVFVEWTGVVPLEIYDWYIYKVA